MALQVYDPHELAPVKETGLDVYVPYAWDETPHSTTWECPDSNTSKEHYIVLSSWGFRISAVGLTVSMRQSGVGDGDGAAMGSLWVDGSYVNSCVVRSNDYTMTGFTAEESVNESFRGWSLNTSHTVSFRLRCSNTTKAEGQIYELAIRGK